MTFKHLTIVKRALALTGLGVLLIPMPGCSAVSGSPAVAQIRFIDASSDAPGLDIYEGSSGVAYNLGFGTLTSYTSITPGTYTISAHSSGSSTALISSRATFKADGQYTVLFGNYVASLQETILTDQSQAAPSGDIGLRFIDQVTSVGAFDIYLVPTGSKITTVSAVYTNLVFGTNTGYLTIPTGTYTLYAIPTGVTPTATTTTYYTGTSITYNGGSASTFVFINEQLVTTPGLQVIQATDYTPAGSS